MVAFMGVPWAPYAAILVCAPYALNTAFQAIRAREIDVNVLMLVAAVGAVLVHRPADAAGLLFLFSLSGTLETYAMAKTKQAIEGLVKLRPTQARRVNGDSDAMVPVNELAIGDTIRVLSFEMIPADGEVLQGTSSVNASAMTGESRDQIVEPGALLLAGTQNLEGMLLARVSQTVGNSTIDKIISLVEQAQENKASGEKLSSWFGERYTFVVIGAFLLSLVVRLLLKQDWSSSLYSSLVLLVALSPCAVVISTPATTLAALAWAAKNGALIRGGAFVETLGLIDTVALDKTGTLTTGRPILAEICACVDKKDCLDDDACWHGGGDMSAAAREMLKYAAAAEQTSNHPLAQAVVTAAKREGIVIPTPTESEVVPGYGIKATIDGQSVKIGRQSFFDTLPTNFLSHVDTILATGATVAILKVGERFAALGLTDELRSDAPAAIASLRLIGANNLLLLTGDNERTAEAIAGQLGLERFHANLLPQDKAQIVAELEESGSRVMMVGDGINDAPVLTRASVGIAMGGLGSDIALNAADIVLMRDSLSLLPRLISLGRRTQRTIRANLIFAIGVMSCLTLLSLVIQLPLPVAVVGHEGSTVLVIINGLRLLFHEGTT